MKKLILLTLMFTIFFIQPCFADAWIPFWDFVTIFLANVVTYVLPIVLITVPIVLIPVAIIIFERKNRKSNK